ncbi:transposase [Ktedonobacteria bacterium brp13]|nr:transposase [Ktedonobacteria bacterium brp13]
MSYVDMGTLASCFDLPENMAITSVHPTALTLTIDLACSDPTACCPLCHQPSERVHSRYSRKVADVPCGGRRVLLLLTVRKYICHTGDCPRSIFTERLPELVQSYARMTNRLRQWIEAIGRATSGEVGARLAEHLGMCISPTTILRRLMALFTPPVGTVSVLGIDDWSFRRGRKFGTILVDLTTHAIIDLLPDRNAETTTAWMRLHPEIEIVSRDRGEDYAAAARAGAPQAIQCADRFHLAKNLTEIVEEILARCRAEIRQASKPVDAASAQPDGEHAQQTVTSLGEGPAPDSPAGSAHLAHHAERLDRYQQLVELRNEGLMTKEIARRLDMAERTVRYWLKRGISYGNADSRRKEGKRIDPYMAYVTERWNQGEHNGLTLFRELQTQGYRGSPRTVYRFLEVLRGYPASLQGRAEHAQTLSETPLQQFAAHQAVWLFVREHSDLDETEQAELASIRQASPTANTVYELTQDFMRMLRHREGERLDTWLENVRNSQIGELQRMVRSIERDKAAVLAGLTLSHSNGVVEGKVHKLKFLKRMGYGRAGFALLRQRVLHAL